MNNTIEQQILEAEEQLRQAMLATDLEALDRLLAPELMFTSHLGQLLRKEDDLAAHRSGMVKIDELIPSERHIQIHGDVAVVSVRVHLSGSYADTPSQGNFGFTRI
jgi:hypothetical protein